MEISQEGARCLGLSWSVRTALLAFPVDASNPQQLELAEEERLFFLSFFFI